MLNKKVSENIAWKVYHECRKLSELEQLQVAAISGLEYQE